MKALVWLLIPFAAAAVVYLMTLQEISREELPHVQPEWTTDRYGRPHPNPLYRGKPLDPRYNPPPPTEAELEQAAWAEARRIQEARLQDQKDLEESWLETTEEKQARIKARDEANRLANPPSARFSKPEPIGKKP